jgi:hypothetical protein
MQDARCRMRKRARADEADLLRQICKDIERDSHKGQRRRLKPAYPRRLAYIQMVLNKPIFAGTMKIENALSR